MSLFRCFAALFALLLVYPAAEAAEILLSNGNCSVRCEAETLRVEMKESGFNFVSVSEAQPGLGQVKVLETNADFAIWEFPEHGVKIRMGLEKNRLDVHISAKKTGEFTFPILAETSSAQGWILPMFEGVYAPVGDAKWISFLTSRGEMNTTADFTMPLFGMQFDAFTLACVVTNPFNNTLHFQTNTGRFQARLTHQFTRNHAVKEYGVFFQLGKNSPVEPARIYRGWLQERGGFVSLREKIKTTPEAEKLLGAAHVYVWGEEIISAADILNWKKFAQKIVQSTEAKPSPAKRIWSLMNASGRSALATIATAEWADKFTKSLVIENINELLSRADFYEAEAWNGARFDKAISDLLHREKLGSAETTKLNSALMFAAFPDLLAKPENWGGGVSPKMMKQFSDAGLDRLWIGSGSWNGFLQRPETVDTAKQLGFLIGPYDSYHSMHAPNEPNTWETAQFDDELFQTGAIVNADGSKRHGFKKKGFLLSPIAARPYVEKRVNGLMKQFKANSWFIDCDGFGEFFDDFSPAHPATQFFDMQARVSRMAWIRDHFGAVIGTEGCSAAVASTVHFAHGVMTPVIGWGDPDLTDKKSKYFLGAYYPAGEPAIFFKPAPIKEEYRYIFYDPRFRLPLFQTVFHDSVVATHHWTAPSLKFPEVAATNELLELLYNVPPLYHLNPAEFEKQKKEIERHYGFFSPLHRRLALLPMTDFLWLNPERTVQKTLFGDCEILANFSGNDFQIGTFVLPPGSVAVEWPGKIRREIYRVGR